MSALTVTPSRSRPMSGNEGAGCVLCEAEGHKPYRPTAKIIWLLGYPYMPVCQPHLRTAQGIWDGALDPKVAA